MPDARSDQCSRRARVASPGHRRSSRWWLRRWLRSRRSARMLFRPAPGFLEIEMRATGGSAAQLFWTSTWAFSQKTAVVALHAHPGVSSACGFHCRPAARIRTVRSARRPGRHPHPPGAGDRHRGTHHPDDRPDRAVAALSDCRGHEAGVRRRPDRDHAGANDPMLLLRSQWLTARRAGTACSS